jgi:hypothetical protein
VPKSSMMNQQRTGTGTILYLTAAIGNSDIVEILFLSHKNTIADPDTKSVAYFSLGSGIRDDFFRIPNLTHFV